MWNVLRLILHKKCLQPLDQQLLPLQLETWQDTMHIQGKMLGQVDSSRPEIKETSRGAVLQCTGWPYCHCWRRFEEATLSLSLWRHLIMEKCSNILYLELNCRSKEWAQYTKLNGHNPAHERMQLPQTVADWLPNETIMSKHGSDGKRSKRKNDKNIWEISIKTLNME